MRERIGIIGAGPVGTCVAAYLATGGHEVTLCDVRTDLLDGLDRNGIRVEGVQTFSAPCAAVVHGVDRMAKDPPSTLFVAVKATALPLLASALQEFVRPDMTVVSWQNGIETEAVLGEALPPGVVVRAIVNYGVSLISPGCVRLSFHHPPHLLKEFDAAGQPKAEKLAQLLSECGLGAERTEQLINHIWRKAIMNAALNPVCALTGLTMAQAWADPFIARIAEELLREGIRVARANEIELGWDYHRWALRYMRNGGNHKPSMLLDIEAGVRTEIDFINGRIVEFADAAGIDAPFNRAMRDLVKALEERPRRAANAGERAATSPRRTSPSTGRAYFPFVLEI